MSPLFPPSTMQDIIEATLASFRAPASVISTERGPRLTRFGLKPAPGIRVGSIVRLAPDLALALAAPSVSLTPIAGTTLLGLDVAHEQVMPVLLSDLLATTAFMRSRAALPLALGVTATGQPVMADLAELPHLLVAGETGSGKSTCLHALITSLVARHDADALRFMMVDVKKVELAPLNNTLPHLLAPVVTEVRHVSGMLRWLLQEMDHRYSLMAGAGVRDRLSYNALVSVQRQMPALVLIVDEMGDLMQQARAEVEPAVTRLAAMGRATGIHLVLATQRPSVNVLTGVIKANFPARIAFAVRSAVDSRTILDQKGAEQLLGKGDGLFLAPGAAAPLRFQGACSSEQDVARPALRTNLRLA